MTGRRGIAGEPEWYEVGKARAASIRISTHRIGLASLVGAVVLVAAIVVTYRSIPPDPIRPLVAILTAVSALCLLVTTPAMQNLGRRAIHEGSIDLHRGRKIVLGLGLYCALSIVCGLLGTFLAAVLTPFTPWPTVIALAGCAALGVVASMCSRWFRRGRA